MELIELTKSCTKCGKRKSWKKFEKSKGGKFGKRGDCRKCRNIYKIKRSKKINVKLNRAMYETKNKNKIAARCKAYKILNKKKARAQRLKRKNKDNAKRRILRKNNPKYKLNNSVSKLINLSLKGNKAGRHWELLVGYTLSDLIEHLEKQFIKGMAWKNQGEWHLDHKIPVSVFNFTQPEHEDFKRCWALKNLQPMWAVENMSKGAKLTKHFQPSLLI